MFKPRPQILKAAKLCWGGCGCWLVFRRSVSGRSRIIAFDVKTRKHHRCPRQHSPKIFVEAMDKFSEPLKCNYCSDKFYEVPTHDGIVEVVQFDDGWKSHDCPSNNRVKQLELLPDSLKILNDRCSEFKLPKPYRLVIIVCIKPIRPPDPTAPNYLVALKSVSGEKFCSDFTGQGVLRLGHLSALCGNGNEQRLLTNSNHIFAWASVVSRK